MGILFSLQRLGHIHRGDPSENMPNLGIELCVEEVVGGILLTEGVPEQGTRRGTFGGVTVES